MTRSSNWSLLYCMDHRATDFSVLKICDSAHSNCCTTFRGFFCHEIACESDHIYIYIYFVSLDIYLQPSMLIYLLLSHTLSTILLLRYSCSKATWSSENNSSFEVEPRAWRGVLDTTLCDTVCQWLATGRWFSPVSSTNITEILLKVALNTINQKQPNLTH
jgi:hypothetical protein